MPKDKKKLLPSEELTKVMADSKKLREMERTPSLTGTAYDKLLKKEKPVQILRDKIRVLRKKGEDASHSEKKLLRLINEVRGRNG